MRWESYAGWQTQGLQKPDAVLHQAENDRDSFADQYVMRGHSGAVKWSAACAIRFLIDICGLTFDEARNVVTEYTRGRVQVDLIPPTPPEETAKEILTGHTDLMDAVYDADHLLSLVGRENSVAVAYWEKVAEAVKGHRTVPLSSGLENWPDATA